MSFSDEINRIIKGDDVEDVINGIFEAVSHGTLGKLKKALRQLKTLAPRGFSKTIQGKVPTRQQMHADRADMGLKVLCDYFLPLRVNAINDLQGEQLNKYTIHCQGVHGLANDLNHARVNDSVLMQGMLAAEAAKELMNSSS